MSSFFTILQMIRGTPGVWLGKKTLSGLMHFRHGYEHREFTEAFEKQDRCMKTCSKLESNVSTGGHRHHLSGFVSFVHVHYGIEMSANSAEGLICERSSSEEEAFDKYFELLDAFCEQKGLPIPYPIPHINPHSARHEDI